MIHSHPQLPAEEAARTSQNGAFPLEKAWIYKVTVLSDLVARRVSDVVQRTSGLNLSQWRVIAAIADDPGCTATQVVARTPMDKAIVSRAVSSLIDRDFVERTASRRDGRVSHLTLTPAGLQAYETIVAALNESQADGTTVLADEDHDAFLAMLDTVITGYDPGT